MKTRFIRLIWAVAPMLLAGMAHAEMYKWVDEHGKVHFSDKRPNAAAQTHSVARQQSSHRRIPTVIDRPVQPRDRNQKLRQQTLIYPTLAMGGDDEVGVYYFGGDCVSPTSMSSRDLRAHHPKFLPHFSKATKATQAVFAEHRFQSGSRNNKADLASASKARGIILQAEIVDMAIHACANKLPLRRGAIKRNPDEVHFLDFKRSKVYLKVRWTLINGPSGDTLEILETEGLDQQSWQQDLDQSKVADTFLLAYQAASQNLLASSEVIAHFYSQGQAKKRIQLLPKDQGEDKSIVGWVTGLVGGDTADKQKLQRLARNLSVVTARVDKLYNKTSRLPNSLAELGVVLESPLWQRLGAEQILMLKGGEIQVQLDPVIFPKENALLVVKPAKDYASTGQWQCLSDLLQPFMQDLPCQ